jgi:hypothetical protein
VVLCSWCGRSPAGMIRALCMAFELVGIGVDFGEIEQLGGLISDDESRRVTFRRQISTGMS